MWLKIALTGVAALAAVSSAYSSGPLCRATDQQNALGPDHPYDESPLIEVLGRRGDAGAVWAYSIVIPKNVGRWEFTRSELSFRSEGVRMPDMYLSLEMHSKDQVPWLFHEPKDSELHGFLVINDQKFDVVYFRAFYGCVDIGKTLFPHSKSLNPDAGDAGAG